MNLKNSEWKCHCIWIWRFSCTNKCLKFLLGPSLGRSKFNTCISKPCGPKVQITRGWTLYSWGICKIWYDASKQIQLYICSWFLKNVWYQGLVYLSIFNKCRVILMIHNRLSCSCIEWIQRYTWQSQYDMRWSIQSWHEKKKTFYIYYSFIN